MTARPDAVGLMYDNTTVHGSWINQQNMTEVSLKFNGRIINNISLAMPHASIFAAARDPINNIMQPQDLMVDAATVFHTTLLTCSRDSANTTSKRLFHLLW